jgi:hypothetical protein
VAEIRKTAPKAQKAEAFEVDHRDQVRLTFHAPLSDEVDRVGSPSKRLPAGIVEAHQEGGLKINMAKLVSSELLRDQRNKLVSSMGCISNPGGPGC